MGVATVMNILAIGAHPDDIELGCGGTLIKAARRGHNVFMYVLTRGGRSGDPIQRTNELLRSAKFVGAKELWIDNFEDANVVIGKKLVSHIEYFVHRSNPDIILTHAANDYHHDHRAIAEATLEAARNSQNVMAYEIPITRDFKPQVYCDITDVIDDKVRLVEIFTSQKDKMFTRINAIKGIGEYRALQSRLNTTITHVESFEVLKMCFNQDFGIVKLDQKPLPHAVLDEISKSSHDILQYRAHENHKTISSSQIDTDAEDSIQNVVLGKNHSMTDGNGMRVLKRIDI